jgi:hypothetical protein
MFIYEKLITATTEKTAKRFKDSPIPSILIERVVFSFSLSLNKKDKVVLASFPRFSFLGSFFEH